MGMLWCTESGRMEAEDSKSHYTVGKPALSFLSPYTSTWQLKDQREGVSHAQLKAKHEKELPARVDLLSV